MSERERGSMALPDRTRLGSADSGYVIGVAILLKYPWSEIVEPELPLSHWPEDTERSLVVVGLRASSSIIISVGWDNIYQYQLIIRTIESIIIGCLP